MTKRSPERAQFLADVLTTAVEGGINYWAQVSEYRWYSPDLDGGTATHEAGLANAYVTVHEREPDDETVGGTFVDLDDIARALGKVKDIKGLADSYRKTILAADRTNDGGDIDAELADIVMQVAVLGEVVYG